MRWASRWPGSASWARSRCGTSAVRSSREGSVRCVRSPLVMKEYWHDPEMTAKVIKDGWFHTGDLGRWDDDGFLHLVDRIKDVIITGQTSANVYSSLLEDVLTRHPGVRAAAVVGL